MTIKQNIEAIIKDAGQLFIWYDTETQEYEVVDSPKHPKFRGKDLNAALIKCYVYLEKQPKNGNYQLV